jgi:hypothetical protein
VNLPADTLEAVKNDFRWLFRCFPIIVCAVMMIYDGGRERKLRAGFMGWEISSEAATQGVGALSQLRQA